MNGNLNVGDIVFHSMVVLGSNYTQGAISIIDDKTLGMMYKIETNTTSCTKFVKSLISQNSDETTTKTLEFNTSQGEFFDITLATNSKFPVMKNMIRRLGHIYQMFSKLYSECKMSIYIDGNRYIGSEKILDHFMSQEPEVFGKKIRFVTAHYNINRSFEKKKFYCSIKIMIEVEK